MSEEQNGLREEGGKQRGEELFLRSHPDVLGEAGKRCDKALKVFKLGMQFLNTPIRDDIASRRGHLEDVGLERHRPPGMTSQSPGLGRSKPFCQGGQLLRGEDWPCETFGKNQTSPRSPQSTC